MVDYDRNMSRLCALKQEIPKILLEPPLHKGHHSLVHEQSAAFVYTSACPPARRQSLCLTPPPGNSNHLPGNSPSA